MAETKNNLPQIAQSRLRQQAGASADAHPDANVLSAFIEQALGSAERENVLSHLAVCADCREIVALSLPETSEDLSNVPVHYSVWNWGMLRWGAVAVGVVVVAAAALLLKPSATLRKDVQVSQMARLEKPEQASRQESAPEESVHAERDQKNFVREPQQLERKKESRPALGGERLRADNAVTQKNQASQASSPVAAPATAAARPQGAVIGGAMAGTAAPMQPSKSVAPGASSGIGYGVGGGIGVGTGRGFGPGFGSVGKVAQSQPPPQMADSADLAKSAENAPKNPNVQNLKPSGRNLENLDTFAKLDVKKSESAKETKAKDENAAPKVFAATETVEVTAEAATVETSSSQVSYRPVVNTGKPWRIDRKGKLLSRGPDGSWHEIAFADNPRFRVLVVPKGTTEIWAGAAQGILYHSPDMGRTWALVQGGWPVQADIVKLKFPDALHGTLTTSQKENWTTSDGGKSWQKQ